ncbi:MAG: carbohydrate kinase family protein [Ardenticatenales bacterium]|nr:carbohydrate kinase family protein [Ardenticatenales bacterium]
MSDLSSMLEKPILVFGGAALDAKARAIEPLVHGSSVPGQIRVSVGGVARNIAECLARLEVPTILFTAVGDDSLGEYILERTAHSGVDISPSLRVPAARTSAYLAMFEPEGPIAWAMDDMGILAHLTPEVVSLQRHLIEGARAVVLDNNLPLETMERIIQIAREAKVPICADPTSRYLASRFVPFLPYFNFIAPNQQEAGVLCDCEIQSEDDALKAAQQLVRRGVRMALITMGDMGVIYATTNESGHIRAPAVDILDPTGASDAMTATVVYALIHEFPVDEAVRLAVTAAMLTLTSQDTVRNDLSLELLYDSLVV